VSRRFVSKLATWTLCGIIPFCGVLCRRRASFDDTERMITLRGKVMSPPPTCFKVAAATQTTEHLRA
jgi:hypothetical protein